MGVSVNTTVGTVDAKGGVGNGSREFSLSRGDCRTNEEYENVGRTLKRFVEAHPEEEPVLRERMRGVSCADISPEEIARAKLKEASRVIVDYHKRSGKVLAGYCPTCDKYNSLFLHTGVESLGDVSMDLYTCIECHGSFVKELVLEYQQRKAPANAVG